jgi:putative inorganic carbon (HCO3(-)) transporter
MNVSAWCTRIIRWSFYLLFILVPLILTPWNYELFEYNKMMTVYALTAVIAGSWILKTLHEREIRIARTPLDIPIVLFVISQLVSALFSIDHHVSWFGYYSRFNGGMFSVMTYVFLYYAFISNFMTHTKDPETMPVSVNPLNTIKKKKAKFSAADTSASRDPFAIIAPFLRLILVSGSVVAVYAVLERLGIDKNLWVQDVQNRVFSTLGQPNWLAAFIIAIIPLSMYYILYTKDGKPAIRTYVGYVLTALFFFVLLCTRSRSGLIGFAVADIVFWILILIRPGQKKEMLRPAAILHGLFALIVFFNGSYVAQIDRYMTFNGIRALVVKSKTADVANPATPGYSAPALEGGGTESGTIRKYVWAGAIRAWQSTTKTILIGTGTETFAFAFYQYRPAAHNMTSEWDFLYNKAHNEYLNYLATTGTFGLVSYVLLLGVFIGWFIKMVHGSGFRVQGIANPTVNDELSIVNVALFAGWCSILVTNFFGFSVVIMQVFLFLYPAMIFCLYPANGTYKKTLKPSFPLMWPTVAALCLSGGMVLLVILRWYADTLYAKSYRLSRSGQYANAQTYITRAITLNPGEPLYRDEQSTTLTALAAGAFEQQNATAGSELANAALLQNDRAVQTSPNNVNFWKTRTKIYYSLSAYDPKLNIAAVSALQKAQTLSPNDPKILYNLAILNGREGNNDEAIRLMKQAIEIKPNYHDAYYGLYIFYTEIKQPVQARAVLEEYVQKIDPKDIQFTEILGKLKP